MQGDGCGETPEAMGLEGRRSLVLATIVGLSVLWRIVYFVQLSSGPMIGTHQWDQSDMNFMHRWALEISAGDWLTDQALHPHHRWHADLAKSYLATHPDERAELERQAMSGSPGGTPAQRLWDRWYGGKQFHQEPLYPYMVAATYALIGADVRWVFLWQMLLGVAINVLIWRLATRAFGSTVGAAAGLLAVFCSPLVFYELLLIRATSIVFASLALVFVAARALDTPTWRAWVGVGVTTGVAMLLKTTFLLLGLGIFVLLVWRLRRDRTLMLRAACSMVAAVLFCLAPAVARNVVVGAPPTSLTSVGPIAVLSSNAEDTVGKPFISHGSRHAPEVLGKTGGRFLPTLVETLRTNESGHEYLGHLGSRFLWVWHWFEIPANANFYYFQLHAPVLRVLPMTFFSIAPMGLVGLYLSLRRSRRAGPLYLLILSSIPSLVVFGILSRYRLPLVAAMIPFAALTLVYLYEQAKGLRTLALLGTLAAVGALTLATGSGLPDGLSKIRISDYGMPYAMYYEPLIEQAEQAGDWARAAGLIEGSLRVEPPGIREIGSTRPAGSEVEATLAILYARVHERYAHYLREAGDAAGADREFRRSRELAGSVREH